MPFSPVRDILARCALLHDAIADRYAAAAAIETEPARMRILSLLAAREREMQALIQRFAASDSAAVATWLQYAGLTDPSADLDLERAHPADLDAALDELYRQLDGSMAPSRVRELVERIETRRQHDQRRSSFAVVAELQTHARA